MTSTYPLDVGPLAFQGLNEKGHGIAFHGEREVHVPGVLPGEKARVRVLGGGQQRDYGISLGLIEKSEDRVSPPCELSDRCGGCSLQHLSISGQHQWKMERLRSLLEPLMVERTRILPVHLEGESLGFRSKLQWMAGEGEDGKLTLGLFEAHSHRLVSLSSCPVQDPITEGIHPPLLTLLRDAGVTSRWLRAVLIRSNGVEALVVLIHHQDQRPPTSLSKLGEGIGGIPGVSGVFAHQTPEEGNALLGGETECLFGKERLSISFEGFSMETGPVGFMQTQLAGANAMVRFVQQMVPASLNTVVDLYAGAGLFSLALASRAKRVIAVEIDGASARDGKRNLQGLSRDDVEMRCQDVELFLQNATPVEWVVVDPPRAGLKEAVIEGISGNLSPAYLIYVSCHPRSFLRDGKALMKEGYELDCVQPVDLFPHTPHLELVALFRRSSLV